MAEQMESLRINFYKLASIFLRPVPEALRSLVEVVSEQFPGGKWSIIDFLTMMGKDTSNHPSLLPPPPEDGSEAIKKWQKKWKTFLDKWKFRVYEDQVPHLVSNNCDEWDVTLLHCVLCKMEDAGKLSKEVFEGVKSLKKLRNDEYGHRSDDTATRDELKEVIGQVIVDIEKLGPVLSKTVEKSKTVEEFIKDVQDIRKEELHFGSPHEKIIDEWKKERERLQALAKQIRDDACCTLDEMEEVIRHGRERMIQHDEELRQGRERMNQYGEDPCQRGINQASQKKSDNKDVIESHSDLLPYMDKMIAHLPLLGAVLGIGDYASAIMKEPGDPQSRFINILSYWIEVTPHRTWTLFCSRLEKAETFNNLRSKISRDKSC